MIGRLTRSKTRSATELDFNPHFRSYKRPPKLAASFITPFCTPLRDYGANNWSRPYPALVAVRELGCSPWGLGPVHFLLDLVAPTEGLQERRYLGILHSSRVLGGRDLPPLRLPGLFSRILHVPYLCPRTIDLTDMPVLFLGPQRCWAHDISHNLCWGILNRLYGPDLCLRIFLVRPSLEQPKQGFRREHTIFSLALIRRLRRDSNLVADLRLLCARRQSQRFGGRLKCWH
jgi:hypothetical protein